MAELRGSGSSPRSEPAARARFEEQAYTVNVLLGRSHRSAGHRTQLHHFTGQGTRFPVNLQNIPNGPRLTGGQPGQCLLNHFRDRWKRYAALQKCLHGNFVGRIQRTGSDPAGLLTLVCQLQQGKFVEIRGAEFPGAGHRPVRCAAPARRSDPGRSVRTESACACRSPRSEPARCRRCTRSWRARSIADAPPLPPATDEVEQPAGLDDFEALVHQGGASRW